MIALRERHYLKPKEPPKEKNPLFVWVAGGLLGLAHYWLGYALSIPTAILLAVVCWPLGYWRDLRPPKRVENRPRQQLSLGETIERSVEDVVYESVRRSEILSVRIHKKDSGRSEFLAVLKDGSELLLLRSVDSDEDEMVIQAIEAALTSKLPKKELLRVSVERISADYRSAEQAVTIEVPARPFMGKAPSIFAKNPPAPRPFQRVRVGEEITVETAAEALELGHTADVKLDTDSADVWIDFTDGTEALLFDRLDFDELASLREALPPSVSIE